MRDTRLASALDREGFAVLRGVFGPDHVAATARELGRVLGDVHGSVLRKPGGVVYGARNLIGLWPPATAMAFEPRVADTLETLLGEGFGLVRSMFFDKPPSATWSLPWHRDRAIAIKDHGTIAGDFKRPTVKAGVAHVEAPIWLLRRMATARVALDDADDENGPLWVVPGSHRDAGTGEALLSLACPVPMAAGDVLVLRPLVLHRSEASRPGTARHRRTLHFEFAAASILPRGVQWHTFVGRPVESAERLGLDERPFHFREDP